MPKTSVVSKAIAAAFVVLTVSVIGGIITMIILYKTEISTMNPTPRPTRPVSTTVLPPVMRLPKNLIPLSYKVFLMPQLYTRIIEKVNVTSPNQTMDFLGNSTVSFQCVERTSTIYLKSMNLAVSNGKVKNENTNKMIEVSAMKTHRDDTNFLEIQLREALEEGGNYSLFLTFKGEISENLDGMYVSTYVEGVFLVATQLEPADARKVFPCFDEPDMKAEFHVTIIHRRDTIALGNAEISGEEAPLISLKAMSTYLFAFTVSEFTATPSTHERVQINTYARPEATAAGHAQYAASITGKILSFYENYFGIDYTQKKLDQIALPDLAAAAMENWGLVTYYEGSLLYEEGVSSVLNKEQIATTIAHELAHQWFGNLVTMKWWNDVWLNEGFATYMSLFAVDNVEPTFQLVSSKELNILANLHTAFEMDALASSHPLSPPQEEVQKTSSIIQMFNSITYCKGAAVLRMLADIVGERVFIEGVKTYLSDFSYKNTDQNDLWRSIQKAEDKNGGHTQVARFMEPWTKQIGYPVITINTTNGEVNQKHFLFNDSAESRHVLNGRCFSVPIRLQLSTVMIRIIPIQLSYEFLSKNGEWILANINCTGYYRVNYNPENWDRLLTQLEIDPHVRQLIDNAFFMARAKLVEVTLALNSTRFLRKELDFLPWQLTVRNLEYFVVMFDRSEVYGPMQACVIKTSFFCLHSQMLAIEVACSNELPECLEMATKMFADWMNSNNTNPIHPNLRSVIYCQAVAAGGKKEWDFAWARYQSSSDTSEKEQLRVALSCTKKTWLLNRYLEYTLDPDKIRLMDVDSTISDIAWNPAGHALAWNFIRAHWDYVSQSPPYVTVPPKQVPSRGYSAEAPWLRPVLSAVQDDCDWFKETPTNQSTFFSHPGMLRGPLPWRCGGRSGNARLV
uniref:Aminopeptidase n=1 Tax=Sander lucioperca TaxID=283035 RepID=A0A8C9X018_SANLU